MGIEEGRHAETGSVRPQVNPYWLAGFLVARGSIEPANPGVPGKPIIKIGGKIGELQRLQQLLILTPQTSLTVNQKNEATLRIAGSDAVSLLTLIRSTLTQEINLVKQIDAAFNGNKDQITALRRQRRIESINAASNPYEELVENADFLAGFLEGRHSFFKHGGDGNAYAALRIQSTDADLMKAMEKKIGMPAKKFKESFIFRLYGRSAFSVYAFIQEHLVLTQEETEEKFIKKENDTRKEQKAFAQKHALYLAGFFEGGGSIHMAPGTEDGRNILRTGIAIHGNIQKITALEEFLHVFKPQNKPITKGNKFDRLLYIGGGNIFPIVKEIQHFVSRHPALRKVAAFVDKWDLLKFQERVDFYNTNVVNVSAKESPKIDYNALVKHPQYVAGLLDSHRSIGVLRTSQGYRYPFLSFSIQSLELIQALQTQYGGNIKHFDNMYTWQLRGAELRNFYSKVRDFLVVHKERGEALLGRSHGQALEFSILQTLASTLQPNTATQIYRVIKQRVNAFAEVTQTITQEEINGYIEKLLQEGKINREYTQQGIMYSFTLTHKDNLAIVKQSPYALKELLIQTLKANRLLILAATTGDIVGIESPSGEIVLYRDIDRNKLMQRLAYHRKHHAESGFLQTPVSGIMLDCVLRLSATEDDEKNALREAITYALEESLVKESELESYGLANPIITFNPESEAWNIIPPPGR